MLKTYVRVMDGIRHLPTAARELARNQSGQDAFEYLLVIGGISAALVLAMVTPIGDTLITAVIGGTCAAIATAMPSVTCP